MNLIPRIIIIDSSSVKRMKYSRQDGGQGEHLSGQVGEVSQDEDERWLNYLDLLSDFGQERDQQAEHKAQKGTTKRHHKEGYWKERDDTCVKGCLHVIQHIQYLYSEQPSVK